MSDKITKIIDEKAKTHLRLRNGLLGCPLTVPRMEENDAGVGIETLLVDCCAVSTVSPHSV